jgi:8-oxo-dGTP diphosphatase
VGIVVVTAGIIEREGRVLLARRGPGGHLAHQWEFPGGKIEPGETPEVCLARELREELGIETRVGERVATSIHDYGRGAIELQAYRAEVVTGEPEPREHEALEWVPIAALLAYDLAAADVPIARALASMPPRG